MTLNIYLFTGQMKAEMGEADEPLGVTLPQPQHVPPGTLEHYLYSMAGNPTDCSHISSSSTQTMLLLKINIWTYITKHLLGKTLCLMAAAIIIP